MKGYFDRIEDEKLAVILVEEHGKELLIPVEKLPQGSQPKVWFHLTMEGEQISSIQMDDKKTVAQQEKVSAMLEKLRAQNKGSKFRKKEL